MLIRLTYTGRGYDVGASLPQSLELDDGASLEQALAKIDALLPDDRRLPASCLLAVSGKHLGSRANHAPHQLSDGDELAIIAPVAGG